MASPEIAGTYVFLVSARDDHGNRDKGHRRRWALQHNQQEHAPATIAFTHHQTTSHGRTFSDSMKRMGYKRLPDAWNGSYYDWYHYSPTITAMRRALEDPVVNVVNGQKTVTGYFNPKRLKTVLFSGHGKDAFALLIDGNHRLADPPSQSQRYLTTTAYYQANQWIQGQACLLLESVQPGTVPFSNLDLAFLVG